MELYKLPYKYKAINNCEAIVFRCMDFRFWRETQEFIDKELNIKSYDFVKLPGGAKIINELENGILINCIEVSCRLHQAEKVILINHSDCGAYGGSAKFNNDKKAEQEFHFEELKKARSVLIKKFPKNKIRLFYAGLSQDESETKFIEVA